MGDENQYGQGQSFGNGFQGGQGGFRRPQQQPYRYDNNRPAYGQGQSSGQGGFSGNSAYGNQQGGFRGGNSGQGGFNRGGAQGGYNQNQGGQGGYNQNQGGQGGQGGFNRGGFTPNRGGGGGYPSANDRLIRQNETIIKILREIRDRLPTPEGYVPEDVEAENSAPLNRRPLEGQADAAENTNDQQNDQQQEQGSEFNDEGSEPSGEFEQQEAIQSEDTQ